jgi:hypothetical protein
MKWHVTKNTIYDENGKDVIEATQWYTPDYLLKICNEHNAAEALQQENEQLNKGISQAYIELHEINERLDNVMIVPKDYRNPADVEALKVAREALRPLIKLAVLVNNEKYAKGEYKGAGIAMRWVDKAKEALAKIAEVADN